MIIVSGLEKTYSNNRVLDKLSIEFSSKGIDIIVGINGSGKTTLLNCICDITPFQSGKIEIDSIDRKEKEAKLKMYYIPSDFYLPEYLSGKEYAEFVFSRYRKPNSDLFEFVINLYNLKSEIHKKISDYSYGMKKKLQIAISLALDVQYIFADEVFNGLDYESYLLTEYLINRFSEDRKFILISHNMDYINRNAQADVFLLSCGNIQLVTDTSKIEEIVINNGELKNHYAKIERFIYNNQSSIE
ncbi:ATP-binding cassette domain-containing protein [Bacillus halotolerans]|uniref:ATP-binding cassette domain-containing protein n=1 Tax=Bacillus halotolerans TaxID=260554 RepID=UPI002DB8FEF9|nr:ATP-binding cassette domain-containing protein [Bacillus halotolerans]MEC1661930.1 ATP-binding cassette domain-containing protein [Bacillus halotolerans]